MTAATDEPAGPTRARQYLRTLATSYVLMAATVGTHLVSIPLYLAWLGGERYGFWLILLQLIWAGSFVTTWIAAPIAREAAACRVANDSGRLRRLFWTGVLYYGAWGALAIGAAALVSPALGPLVDLDGAYWTEARTATMVVGMSFAASIQLNFVLSLLTGYQRMHVTNLLTAVVTVLGAAVGLTLVAAGMGLAGAAAGHLASQVCVGLPALVLFRRASAISSGRPVGDAALLARILRTGSGYFVYGVSFFLLQSDILLVGFLLGPSGAAVYGVASKTVEQIGYSIRKIPDSLFPITAELSVRGHLDRLRPAHRAATRVTLMLSCFAAALIVLHGGALLEIWVGAAHTVGQPVLTVLAAVLVVQAFIHTSVAVPFGASRMGGFAVATLIEGVIKVGVALLLIPVWGMAWAAGATLIAHALCTLWYAPALACRLTGDSVSSYVRSVAGPLLPAVAGLGLTVLAVQAAVPPGAVQRMVGTLAAGVAYVGLYLKYGLGLEEREWLSRALRAWQARRDERPTVVGSSPR